MDANHKYQALRQNMLVPTTNNDTDFIKARNEVPYKDDFLICDYLSSFFNNYPFIYYHAYVHGGSTCHRSGVREYLCRVGSLLLPLVVSRHITLTSEPSWQPCSFFLNQSWQRREKQDSKAGDEVSAGSVGWITNESIF